MNHPSVCRSFGSECALDCEEATREAKVSRAKLTRPSKAMRGFTLVEIMVAMTAGIAVAGAAYLLSKGSLEAFNTETRISAAQFSATLGMNRLVSDVSRAGYQMSPNIALDVGKQCGTSGVLTGPAYSRFLAVQVIKAGEAGYPAAYPLGAAAAFPENASFKAPDVLRIAGNFQTTEQFEFRTIQGTTVTLAMNRGATQRFLREMDMGGPTWTDVFPPDSWVRIVDGTGREQFVQLDGTGGNACNFTTCTLTLVGAPFDSGFCGPGTSRGLINPISIVDYWVGNITGVAPATIGLKGVAPADLAPRARVGGDANRTEFLRTENALAPNGVLTPQRTEVVAEYAVGFSVGATWRATNPPAPTLASIAPGVAWPLPRPNAEKYVSMTVRLQTRARVPDRDAPSTNPMGRYAVCSPTCPEVAAAPNTIYARVRTLTREVSLPNLAGVTW